MHAADRAPPLSLRARVLAQTGLQLSGKAATMLSGLFLFSILTRYLGVNGFGSYTFVIGYLSLFAVLTDLGSQAIAVREMARNRGQADRVAGQFFALKAVMVIASAAIALCVAFLAPVSAFHYPGVLAGIAVCSAAMLSAPFGGTANAVFQMALRMQVPVLADVASRLVMLAGVIVLVAGTVGLASTPASKLDSVLILSSLIGVAASLFVYVGAQRVVRFRPVLYDRLLLWPMVRASAPLAIVLVLGMIHYRIDVFILAAMKGKGSVGLYGVATKLLDVSLAVSAMFMSVAFPVLSARAAGEPLLLRRAFQKSADLMLILGAGIAVFAATLSPFLVLVVGGPAYARAALPLAVIAWAAPVMLLNQVFSHMVVAANRQLRGVPIVLGAAAVNIVLNVALIPRLGAVAPALVTDVTESITAAGMGIVMFRHFGFAPSPSQAVRILAAAAIAGATVLVLYRMGPILAMLGGGAVYLLALLGTGAIGRDDLAALLRREMPS